MNVVNFFSYLSKDIGDVCNNKFEKYPNVRAGVILSVALRAIGALVMLIAAAVLISGIVLAASSPIGLGIGMAVGAILLGVIAYDAIQVGQNCEFFWNAGRVTGFQMCVDESESLYNGTILARYFFADDDSCLIS